MENINISEFVLLPCSLNRHSAHLKGERKGKHGKLMEFEGKKSSHSTFALCVGSFTLCFHVSTCIAFGYCCVFQCEVCRVTLSTPQRLSSIALTRLTSQSISVMSTLVRDAVHLHTHIHPPVAVHSRKSQVRAACWWPSPLGRAELVWLRSPRALTTHHLLMSAVGVPARWIGTAAKWQSQAQSRHRPTGLDRQVRRGPQSSRSPQANNDAHSLVLSKRRGTGVESLATQHHRTASWDESAVMNITLHNIDNSSDSSPTGPSVRVSPRRRVSHE